MRYITIPNEISSNSLVENGYCLAPSKLTRFTPNPNVQYKTLDELITTSTRRIKIEKQSRYIYYEIGDIEVMSGFIDGREFFGYFLPSDTPLEVKSNDILVSTVRTYRKGIGIVVDESETLVCSPACLLIRDVSHEVTKEYLLAFLRSDFFVEQILAFLNRGMYPRLDREAMRNIYIPLPNSGDLLKYISTLQRAVINKEREIRRKHNLIHEKIRVELESNQKADKFNYEFPSLEEVKASNRLDTNLFRTGFKKNEFLIKNYANGIVSILDLDFGISRGQNLQISAIGESIYTNNHHPKFYTLMLPKYLSRYGTVDRVEYLGNRNKLKTLNKGDLIFGAEGFEKGRSIVVTDETSKTITNIHGITLHHRQGNMLVSIFVKCFLDYLRNIGLVDLYAVGGNGGSLAMKYWDIIPFPDFPEGKQSEIAKLYHNAEAAFASDQLTVENFIVEDSIYNEAAGIVELHKTAKKIKARIDEAVDLIVRDKSVEIDFTFLSS
jgi:type I restriction enzyme S subunit